MHSLLKAAAMLPFCCVVLAACVWLTLGPAVATATQIWPTPEDPITKVVIRKSERVMELWRGPTKVRNFRISLGGNPVGHKQSEGDGRTPEGSYVLDFRKSDSVAHKAIHISYPSAQDIANARSKGLKPGGNIMIHGIWNGFGWAGGIMKYFDWTNGCIGLNNAEMDEIWEMLAWKTPIEILP